MGEEVERRRQGSEPLRRRCSYPRPDPCWPLPLSRFLLDFIYLQDIVSQTFTDPRPTRTWLLSHRVGLVSLPSQLEPPPPRALAGRPQRACLRAGCACRVRAAPSADRRSSPPVSGGEIPPLAAAPPSGNWTAPAAASAGHWRVRCPGLRSPKRSNRGYLGPGS